MEPSPGKEECRAGLTSLGRDPFIVLRLGRLHVTGRPHLGGHAAGQGVGAALGAPEHSCTPGAGHVSSERIRVTEVWLCLALLSTPARPGQAMSAWSVWQSQILAEPGDL